jgi:hypothetical protein
LLRKAVNDGNALPRVPAIKGCLIDEISSTQPDYDKDYPLHAVQFATRQLRKT